MVSLMWHGLTREPVASGLFDVLVEASLDLRDLTGRELDERAKYAELVMKVSRPAGSLRAVS